MGKIFGFLGWTKEDYIEAFKHLGESILNLGKFILFFAMFYLLFFAMAYCS